MLPTVRQTHKNNYNPTNQLHQRPPRTLNDSNSGFRVSESPKNVRSEPIIIPAAAKEPVPVFQNFTLLPAEQVLPCAKLCFDAHLFLFPRSLSLSLPLCGVVDFWASVSRVPTYYPRQNRGDPPSAHTVGTVDCFTPYFATPILHARGQGTRVIRDRPRNGIPEPVAGYAQPPVLQEPVPENAHLTVLGRLFRGTGTGTGTRSD